MDKRFLIILLVIALALGGVFFLTSGRKAGAPSNTETKLSNHVIGKNTDGVKLVEYGDFQCPACGQYYQPVKQVKEKYGDKISFQFRNFPLFQIHPNAIAASRAAEAADMQGKFWEMHDKLFTENYTQQVARSQGGSYGTWVDSSSPETQFEAYAKELGLNVEKYKTDFKSTTVNNIVQSDLREGNKLGVQSTPTFFINGKKISNPDATVEAFSKVIDAEIAKQAKN
jgi:protein-disulfide isomerase